MDLLWNNFLGQIVAVAIVGGLAVFLLEKKKNLPAKFFGLMLALISLMLVLKSPLILAAAALAAALYLVFFIVKKKMKKKTSPFCPECGTRMKEDVCPNCGHKG